MYLKSMILCFSIKWIQFYWCMKMVNRKLKKNLKITSTQKNPEKELSILNHVFKDNLNHLKNVESLKL